MTKSISQTMLIEVRDAETPKGRGVFAVQSIAAHSVVETCPVILIDTPCRELPIDLRRRVFAWNFLAKSDTPCALALGYGSMYNHSNPANLRFEALPATYCLRFTAARDISQGEELTVNYDSEGGGISSDDECWFDTMGVTQIK